MSTTVSNLIETAASDLAPQVVACPSQRVRVDGLAFARGGQRLRVQGVTYGPFAANAEGEPFPTPERAAEDFLRMRACGVNAIRTYHVPPEWLLYLADERGINVLVDVPWPKHLCFLESLASQHEARERVRLAAKRGQQHPCLLGYSIGNEIPTDVLRWHGSRRVQRFLAELMDVVRQTDPDGLVTYASFPPTEYLDLSFLDFVTFNVYLHDRETFRRYLFRLQNLVGERPLVLGELGMDTLRHGETEQADFLAGHLSEIRLMGLAGAFVFSWTDEWHTGGHAVQSWAFGVTHADRSPKASYHALREMFEHSPAELLPDTPRASVVVCSYNGGRTLAQCLESLLALDYPDYEVILVDDGSTDDTPAIAARFPSVRVIRQQNQGLSAARNVGLHAATGSIVAYTDSDCFADPNWLTHLVYQLQRSGAAAVGGPNLTPEDGWLAACVAAAPGQPTHVLHSDQVAEHIPGCNMAFRREALLAINGFDVQYRRAGDDVDVCWRLQQAGRWITFAPGAFVWHHRRQGPRSYLRQQAGYGEAEALLCFQHPDHFNHFGDGKWRGVLYGPSLRGLHLSKPIVYRGTFGSGLFQCLYQPGPMHWAMLPGTLEWHAAAALVALATLLCPWAWVAAAGMVGLSFLVAALQAAQARLPRQHQGFLSRVVIAGLCYAQPLVRSWRRYRTRLFSFPSAARRGALQPGACARLPWSGRLTRRYWSELGHERTDLLGVALAELHEQRWGKILDTGWSDWDVQVYCDRCHLVEVCTVQENHGGNKRLIQARFRQRPRAHVRGLVGLGLVGALAAAVYSPLLAGGLAGLLLLAGLVVWWCGTRRASRVVSAFDSAARKLELFPCTPDQRHDTPHNRNTEVNGKLGGKT